MQLSCSYYCISLKYWITIAWLLRRHSIQLLSYQYQINPMLLGKYNVHHSFLFKHFYVYNGFAIDQFLGFFFVLGGACATNINAVFIIIYILWLFFLLLLYMLKEHFSKINRLDRVVLVIHSFLIKYLQNYLVTWHPWHYWARL